MSTISAALMCWAFSAAIGGLFLGRVIRRVDARAARDWELIRRAHGEDEPFQHDIQHLGERSGFIHNGSDM